MNGILVRHNQKKRHSEINRTFGCKTKQAWINHTDSTKITNVNKENIKPHFLEMPLAHNTDQ